MMRGNMVNEEVEINWGNDDPLEDGGKVYNSAYYCKLSEQEIEKARVELGETEEAKEQCIQELRERLSKAEGSYRMDDAFLLRYLRVRKFDREKAYENIMTYYNMRSKFLDGTVIPSEATIAEDGAPITLLPYTTEEGCGVLLFDFECWNTDEYSFEDIVPPSTTLCQIISMNPKLQVNGVIGIWDLSSFTFKHSTELLRNNHIFHLINLGHYGIPWRIKKIVVVHTNRTIRLLYRLVRPVLTKKLADRVFLLGSDLGDLHKHISPAILPEKLGGKVKNELCHDFGLVLRNTSYLKYERSFTGGKK